MAYTLTKVPDVFGNSFIIIISLSLKMYMFDTFDTFYYSFHGLIYSEIVLL